jgi:hypothetical protein
MHWVWLEVELRRWRAQGRQVRLWWRDDDARAPSPELDRLLTIAHGRPLALAVIPDGDLARLAAHLQGVGGVSVIQHGVDHTNRRDGPSAGEFPHEWRRIRVATQIRAGWARLNRMPGALPVFTPPWNDIHPDLPAVLGDCGYLGWSAWGEDSALGQPPRIDTHLDLMRWKGGARFRGEAKFLGELRRLLTARRRAGLWDAPVGLLTHHLVHDEAAWAFLAQFLDWTSRQPGLAWTGLPDLLAAAGPRARSA